MKPPISLSIITPTIGRPTLTRLIEWIKIQREPGDEHIVVLDGDLHETRVVLNRLLKDIRLCALVPAGGQYGGPARDLGLKVARGDYVWFVGDDDLPAPGAITAIKRGISEDPTRPHIFCMESPGGTITGRDKTLAAGYVGDPMVLFPRTEKLADWATLPKAHCHDWYWVEKHLPEFGPPIWHPDVIYQVRP